MSTPKTKNLFPFFIALIFVFSSVGANAKLLPNSSQKFLKKCAQSTDCELQLIFEIAKTYRPSKEEGELRDYILAIKETSETHFWKKKLTVDQDKIGNLMITLPATGRFAQKNLPHFALQSHMDMVLAYADAKPGENIKPYFKDGIKLEIVDGWLQSVGRKTSIGTDNSTGVAFSLRYLIDPKIEHPPLELIFTVQEEIGLVGAFASELPIRSQKMLCLDGMTPEPGFIIAGSQGGITKTMNLQSDISKTSKGQTNQAKAVIKISVVKLAGGHSGNDIHRGRLNAVQAFAKLVSFISSQIQDSVQIKTVVAGDIGVFNKIPSMFNAELIIPAEKISQDLNERIKAYLVNLVALNSDDAKNAEINIEFSEPNSHEPILLSTSQEFSDQLISAILQTPQGRVEEDAAFFNSIKTSNNLSFLKITPDKDGTGYLSTIGTMTRGFVAEQMFSFSSELPNHLNQMTSKTSLETNIGASVQPWIEPEDSKLLNQVLSLKGFSKKFFMNGGLEPSAFKTKIKNLEVVALGPYQMMAHSFNERLKIDTLAPTKQSILKIIQMQK